MTKGEAVQNIVRRPSSVTLIPDSLAALLLTESSADFRLDVSVMAAYAVTFAVAVDGLKSSDAKKRDGWLA